MMKYPYEVYYLRTQNSGYAQADAGSDLFLDGTKKFTIMAWVYFENAVGYKTILTSDAGFVMGIQGQRLAVLMPGFGQVLSGMELKVNQWYHLAVAYDCNIYRFYVDGCLDSSVKMMGTSKTGNNHFMFGKNLWGCLRTVAVYQDNLSLSKIKASMMDNSGAMYWYDFTQNPPKEKIAGTDILLTTDASIIAESPSANFSNQGFVEVDVSSGINPGGYIGEPYSIQAWIYFQPKEESFSYTILSNTDEGNTAGMTLCIENISGEYHLCAYHGGFELMANRMESKGIITPNKWTNVVLVFENYVYTIYIDGEKDTEHIGLIPMNDNLANHRCYIGSDIDASCSNGVDVFSGNISRLDIWACGLTAEQVLQYAQEEPEDTVEGLKASYRFFDDYVNLADFNSAGKKRGISLSGVQSPALLETRESLGVMKAISFNREEGDDLPVEIIEECRTHAIQQWNAFREDTREEQLFYTVTSYSRDGKRYYIEHTVENSQVCLCVNELEADEVTLWKIELVLIIIGGVGNLIFGLRLQRSEQLRGFILRNITCMGIFQTAFAGSVSTAEIISGIVAVFTALIHKNKLKALLKVAFQIGFWALVRICTTFVFRFLGGWAYYAVQLGSLAVSILAHIANYPESKEAIPSLSLLELTFASRGGEKGALVTSTGPELKDVSTEWNCQPRIESYPIVYNTKSLYDSKGTPYKMFVWAVLSAENVKADKIWLKGEDVSAQRILGDTEIVEMQSNQLKRSAGNHVKFTFSSHAMPKKICKYEVSICWKYSTDQKNWKKIITTNHTVYTLLNRPGVPWVLGLQNIWLNVLEYTYPWVKDITDTNVVMKKVTEAVNGILPLTYDTEYGAPAYTYDNKFLLKALMKDLKNAVSGNKYQVNCSDCANIVTILSNLWGCNLQVLIMSNSNGRGGFRCNEIYAIGSTKSSDWKVPFNGFFSFHAVAVDVKDGKNRDRMVYDACLQVNEGTQPWSPTKKGKLPTGMPFSTIEEFPVVPLSTVDAESYREHLADVKKSDGAAMCKLFDDDYTTTNMV